MASVALSLIAAPVAQASTVCSAGPPTCDYSTIQAALNAASNGDTIEVKPGIYTENIGSNVGNLTITSTTPGDPTAVVIDGNHNGTVVQPGFNWVLEGLTIQNGTTDFEGGGIYHTGGGPLTVSDCIIQSNTAQLSGGGIGVDTAGTTAVIHTKILNNVVQHNIYDAAGGGIATDGPLFIYDNSQITGNQVNAPSGLASGGGISTNDSLTIEGSQISGNTIHAGGSLAEGGGIQGGSYADPISITNTQIENNTAISDSGTVEGGGFYTYRGARLSGTTITGNHADGNAAAIGGGLYTYGAAQLVGTTISGNQATVGTGTAQGGGIYTRGAITLSGGSITTNSADSQGGGIYCYLVPGDLAASSFGSVISSNTAPTDPETSGCGSCTPGAMQSCQTDLTTPGCTTGSQTCTDLSLWGACNLPSGLPTTETACSDAIDNDCDGLVDGDDPDCHDQHTMTAANAPKSTTSHDPVNTYTGEMVRQPAPDLDLGGPLPLSFSRYYASGMAASGVTGRMGTNWRHDFEWTLIETPAYPSWPTQIDVVDPHGRTIHFDKVNSDWVLAPETDVPYQLLNPSGRDYILGDPHTGMLYVFTNDILSGIEDGHSVALTLSYTSNELTEVSDGLGRVLDFTYDVSGHVQTVTDGTRTVTFGYSGDDLVSVTDVRGKTTTYAYDTGGLLTSWTRPRGNTPYTQTYDGSNRVATQTDAASNTWTFAYDPVAGTTTITDPLSHTRVHTHTLHGELLSAEDETGKSFDLGYDSTLRRNKVHDRMGGETTYTYHPGSGRVASITQADGSVTTFHYTARLIRGIWFWEVSAIDYADGTTESFEWTNSGDMVKRTDQAGFDWTYQYDESGLLVAATNPEGGTTTFSYNLDDTLASRTDPSGNTTSYAYDGLRRLVTLTNPDATTVTYTWDSADHPLTVTDERGKTTTFTWDDNGNVATITDPLAHTTTFAYDDLDRLVGVTDPLSHSATLSYNELGRLASSTDRTGMTTTYGYDSRSRLISITDPASNTWSFAWDDEGIPVSRTDPLGHVTTFTSDVLGRVTTATSPLGLTTACTFDPLNRVTSLTSPSARTNTFTYEERGLVSSIDEDGLTLGFSRDSLGLVSEATDGNGQQWMEGRDNQGRIVTLTDPLARVETISYDSRSRPDTVTLPGSMGSVQPTYDDAGNVTQLAYSDATLDYTYDDLNRLTGGSGFAFAYDAAGRMTDSNGLTMTYDDAGRLATETVAPGKTITYAYDSRGLLQTVTDWTNAVTTFTHDDAGRLTSISRPSGVDTTYSWDNDDRLVGITEGALSSIVLTRDADGRVTQGNRSVPTPASASTATAATFTQDAASQISSAGFAFDAMGRRTGDTSRTYAWDLASRLTAYTEAANTVTFTYDALSQLLSRTEGGVTRSYVWNDALGLPSVAVEKEGGSDLRYYVHTPGGALLYSIDAADNARRDYHYDEMGNTLFLTDSAGTVVASYAYGAYGEPLAETGSVENSFTWQGESGAMREQAGELYFMRARWYESRGGRFLSPDPVGPRRPTTDSPYQFAMGDPEYYQDPQGTQETSPNKKFTGSLGDKVLGGATKATGFTTFYGAKLHEYAAEQTIIGAKLLRKNPMATNKAEQLGEMWKQAETLEKSAKRLKTAGWVANRVGNVATIVKFHEASKAAREEGALTNRTALQNLNQQDTVIALKRARLITSEEAERRIKAIYQTFEEANANAWKDEVVENAIGGLRAIKDLAVSWANGLLGGSGDAADSAFTAVGKTGVFVYKRDR